MRHLFQKHLLLLHLFFLLPTGSQAQFAWSSSSVPFEWGGRLGLSVQLGSHRIRVGVLAQGYLAWEHVQLNVHGSGFYHACALGSEAAGLEAQLRVGAVGAFGAREERYRTPFFSLVGQNLGRPASVGYGINFYWDNVHTSQITGSFGASGGPMALVVENDFLVFRDKDRYRTGGIALLYQHGDLQIALQHLAWTADPYSPGTKTELNDAQYPQAKYGFRVLGNQRYHNKSVGLVTLRALYHSPSNTTLGGALGIDAEQIRHAIQNRIIHNAIRNPHIPMIDTQGGPYLFGEGETVRAPRFYGELLVNPTGIY